MSKVRRDPHNIRRNIALNGKYISNDGDSEGILVGDGGIVTVSSALSIKESSSPVNHLDTYGRLWVNNTDPTALYFTNDDGDDIQLTSGAAAIGTISLAADRISVGDAQVNIATSSGDIQVQVPGVWLPPRDNNLVFYFMLCCNVYYIYIYTYICRYVMCI